MLKAIPRHRSWIKGRVKYRKGGQGNRGNGRKRGGKKEWEMGTVRGKEGRQRSEKIGGE